MDEEIKSYCRDHPEFSNPEFQRRVLWVYRPIPIVENMFDVTFECGHAPLIFGDDPPKVGQLVFCPNCYELSRANRENRTA